MSHGELLLTQPEGCQLLPEIPHVAMIASGHPLPPFASSLIYCLLGEQCCSCLEEAVDDVKQQLC